MLASIPVLIVNLYAVISGVSWGICLTDLFILLMLLFGYRKRLDFNNTNLLIFIALTIAAELLELFQDQKSIYLISIFLLMSSYFFLYREALNYTQRETANKFMLIFFILLIGSNAYFLLGHLQEIELRIKGIFEFSFYSVYYVNLMVLGVVGLIYYLNSYSRKSVFFISLVMAVIFSDVFRDMAKFYLLDTSVLVIEYLLKYGAFVLAFQFFATKEKKLRLINLV